MRHMRWGFLVMGLCALMGGTGCGGKQAEIKEDRLTVGRVQGEVKVGMSAAQVAELLGSPNIVTTDDKRHEVWIYDKVSTDRVDTAYFFHRIDHPRSQLQRSVQFAASAHPHHYHQVR